METKTLYEQVKELPKSRARTSILAGLRNVKEDMNIDGYTTSEAVQVAIKFVAKHKRDLALIQTARKYGFIK